MVRLEVLNITWVRGHNGKFQFLYGTIGSADPKQRLEGRYIFQFLYGTIGSTKLDAAVRYVIKFQFLYGTIGSNITN